MYSLLNKYQKLLALSWLSLNLIGLIFITYIHPLKFDGEILNLLTDKGNQDHSITLGQELLLKHSKEIKFGFENMDQNQIAKFKTEIKQNIPELKELSYFSKEELKTFIRNIWPYSLKGETLELFKRADISGITGRIWNLLSSKDFYYYSYLLESDPLLIASPEIKPLISKLKNKTSNILLYKIDTEIEDQILISKIESTISKYHQDQTNSKIHWSAYIKFKNSSANKIKSDIQFVSTLSSILIPITLIIFFGSIGAPILSLVSGLSGLLFGLLLTSFVKDSVHLITLAFGSSLVGASVDYAIHYQSEKLAHSNKNPDELRKIALPSLLIGAFTSILAFCALQIGEFPGLKELSLFSIGSLSASLVSTILWFPYISFIKSNRFNLTPKLFSIFHNKTTAKTLKTIGLIGIVLYSLNYYDLKKPLFQDDIGALQSPEQSILDEELWFNKNDMGKTHSSFIFIHNDKEEVLTENALSLGQELDIFPLSQLPTIEEANISLRTFNSFLKSHKEELLDGFTKLKLEYDPQLIASILEPKTNTYLQSIKEITDKFKVNQTNIALPISRENSFDHKLKNIAEKIPHTTYTHREKISELFKNFRIQSINLVALSYIAILILAMLRYGIKKGLLSFAPSTLSVSSTLVILNLLNIPLSFFGILAFVIVLGLSIDYSAFYLEDKDEGVGAKLSIFLCTLTTIITFGALSLSETESLRNFGIVISLGVLFTAIYTNIIFSNISKHPFKRP